MIRETGFRETEQKRRIEREKRQMRKRVNDSKRKGEGGAVERNRPEEKESELDRVR